MIVYVDTSALVKLVVDEPGTDQVAELWSAADRLASSALITVEARAALASSVRGGRLTSAQHRSARADLADLVEELSIVEVSGDLLAEAGDLAEREALRGYDAVHLASALLIGADVMASADRVLCDAAERRGLAVANPLEA